MIKISNLTTEYKGVAVLQDVNLEVKTSEIVAIIGPSGSGKSTILKCLIGLKNITTGQVCINDKCIVSRGTRDTKTIVATIGLVSQNANLFPNLTVLENIILAPQLSKKLAKELAIKEATKLLALMRLIDKKNCYPSELSGGQAQRVAIIRAMILNPQVLLLDEPTSALDPELTYDVLQAINKLAKVKNVAMLIVTHEISFAKEIADRIVFLDKGKIIANSNSKDFFNNQKNIKIANYIKRIL